MDIFKKVFNGDERLVITFWLWGFVFVWIYYIVVGFVLGMLGLANPLIIALVRLLWIVFILVAVWRSSEKYKGPSHWALLAKIWVVLSAVSVLLGGFGIALLPF